MPMRTTHLVFAYVKGDADYPALARGFVIEGSGEEDGKGARGDGGRVGVVICPTCGNVSLTRVVG